MTSKPTRPTDQGLPPPISIAGGARAVVRTAFDKLPVLSVLTKYVDNLEAQRRAERMALWAEHVRGEEDEQVFSERLDNGLRGPDADFVRAAVLESIRAATDAIDDAVVPAIARLTSRYLTKRDPDHWTYRDILTVLRALDADMLAAFRAAVATLARVFAVMPSEPGFPPPDTGTEFQRTDAEPFIWQVPLEVRGGPGILRFEAAELGRGPVAHRLVQALNGSRAGLFSGEPRINPPHFTQKLVDILVAVL